MGELAVDLRQQRGRGERDVLDPAPGADEGQGADTVDHEVGEQISGLGGRRPPGGRVVLAGEAGERRLPQRHRDLAARRAVVGDRRHVEPGEPTGRLLGRGHGRRGQHERRVGAVGRADPAQPPQHVGDVGSEDAAVVVALVDDDVAQRAQERRPPVVTGQQRAVQHVGVGQDVLGVVAGPVALLSAAVTVVGGDADVEPEAGHRGHLVVGQRLGRREVEHGGAAAGAVAPGRAHRGERRQLVGQRLARGRAGGDHHVAPRPGRVGGLDLVSPRLVDPGPREGRDHVGGGPRGPRGVHRRTSGSTSTWVTRSARPGADRSRSTRSPAPAGAGGGRWSPLECRKERRQPTGPTRSGRDRLSRFSCTRARGVVTYEGLRGRLPREPSHRACWEAVDLTLSARRR